MRTINSTVSSQLAAGRTIQRELVRLELGSGTYGFAKSVQPITFAGVTYQPVSLISVSGFQFGPGTSAQDFAITLPASNDDGRLPSVLQDIFSEDYRDRPVTVVDAHFNSDTGAIITTIPIRYGYINDLVFRHSDEGDQYVIECQSRAIDYSRRNGRLCNDLDQQRRYPGDRFFLHLSQTGRVQVYWGKNKES